MIHASLSEPRFPGGLGQWLSGLQARWTLYAAAAAAIVDQHINLLSGSEAKDRNISFCYLTYITLRKYCDRPALDRLWGLCPIRRTFAIFEEVCNWEDYYATS